MSAWRMPSETAPQDRVWMAFPTGGYTLGDTEEEAHAARSTWAAVAKAILEFEPVTMVVHPDDVDTAARYLDPRVEVLTAELKDRKNRLPAFQRLKRVRKTGSREVTKRMRVAANTARSRTVKWPRTAWWREPGLPVAGAAWPVPALLPDGPSGPAAVARPEFWPKLCWFILFLLSVAAPKDFPVPKCVPSGSSIRPGRTQCGYPAGRLRRKSQFNLSLVNSIGYH